MTQDTCWGQIRDTLKSTVKEEMASSSRSVLCPVLETVYLIPWAQQPVREGQDPLLEEGRRIREVKSLQGLGQSQSSNSGLAGSSDVDYSTSLLHKVTCSYTDLL